MWWEGKKILIYSFIYRGYYTCYTSKTKNLLLSVFNNYDTHLKFTIEEENENYSLPFFGYQSSKGIIYAGNEAELIEIFILNLNQKILNT